MCVTNADAHNQTLAPSGAKKILPETTFENVNLFFNVDTNGINRLHLSVL